MINRIMENNFSYMIRESEREKIVTSKYRIFLKRFFVLIHERRCLYNRDKMLSLIYEGKIMNSNVKVIVDRPLGSYHPKYKEMYYPVNYGFIEGIIAPDGEEQDAYILGVDEAIKEFNGKVIAVVCREDDNEEKWIVVPEHISFSKEEIMNQI